MAKIAPFTALRYDPFVAGDLDKLVTQPYDKIDRKLQKEYYDRHPHNIVRVIFSEENVQNPESDYPEAGKTLRDWTQRGVLKVDDQPAIYVYYQTFTFRGEKFTRKGFIASVELEEKGVRAHEHTLAGPKADRLRLLRATETNDENIFLLFTDPQNEAVKLMDEAIAGVPPIMECKDDYSEIHTVWAIRDPETVAKLQKIVAPKELFIADGHHRFETALNFKAECEKKGWKAEGNQGFDHRMMALFPMEDKGLVIFPTHRLVKNVENFDGEKLMKALAKHFDVHHVGSAEELFKTMDSKMAKNTFGVAVSGAKTSYYFLKLKDLKVMDAELPGVSAASRALDVTVLHKLILENELGIDKAKLEAFSHVEYVRSREESAEKVGKNGIQAAFILNPTDVGDVRDVASVGERMPQKSTDFYPKLLAGLVMMPLTIKK